MISPAGNIDAAPPPLKAPFPWFGGKSRAAHLIWPRFGPAPNYVEPFAGSLAVLLRRPHAPGNEIVNDLDCYVANAWRAMAVAPGEVAKFCDWPVNESDLHARHRWLHAQAEFRRRMEHEPDYFDARIAGFWIWGLSCWIGDNWCRPVTVNAIPMLNNKKGCKSPPKIYADQRLDRTKPRTTGTQGVSKKIPYISKPGGQGVARQVPHLTGGQGVARQVPHLTGGQGVARQVPHLTGGQGGSAAGAASDGIENKRPSCYSWKGMDQLENLQAWFDSLASRLRHVKVCCGDWQRVCTKAATYGQGLTAVLLDPPYDPELCDTVYGSHHGTSVSAEVRAWALANGSNPLLRIALCGYLGEHDMPADWECVAWKASGGYAAAAGNHENAKKERIWFSPHCIRPSGDLFGFVGGEK